MVTTIVMVMILAMMAYLALAMSWAIVGNLRRGEAYRRHMAERLQKLRLARALGLFGIDVQAYLHRENVVDIEQQMSNCANCQATDQCDGVLNDNGSPEAFDFCPNEQKLATMRELDLKANAESMS